jgi:hypothetical protein
MGVAVLIPGSSAVVVLTRRIRRRGRPAVAVEAIA